MATDVFFAKSVKVNKLRQLLIAFKLYVKTGESLLVKKPLKEFFVVKLYQLREPWLWTIEQMISSVIENN